MTHNSQTLWPQMPYSEGHKHTSYNLQYNSKNITKMLILGWLLMLEWTEQTHLSFSLSHQDWHQLASPMEHRPSETKMLALPLHPSCWLPPDPKNKFQCIWLPSSNNIKTVRGNHQKSMPQAWIQHKQRMPIKLVNYAYEKHRLEMFFSRIYINFFVQ